MNRFVKKCAKNLSIDQKDLTLKQIDIDKYNLKTDDLTCLLMFSNLHNNYENNFPLAKEIAISILTTSINKDSWKRIFKATFNASPEDILVEDNDDTLFV